MQHQITNFWANKQPFTADDSQLVYQNGNYKVYKLSNQNFLYTYKGAAINQLAGLNKSHVDSLVLGFRPSGEGGYTYDRAKYFVNIIDNIIDNQ